MTHVEIETELRHIERILPLIRHGPFPVSYWHARVEGLREAAARLTPDVRIDTLQKELASIDDFLRSAFGTVGAAGL